MDEFSREIEKNSEGLYAYLFRRTRSHHTSEDLLQETLLKAFLALEEIQPDNLEAWLMTIAKYTMFDHLKKQRRVKLEEADFFEKQIYPTDFTENLVETAELQQALRLLKKLPKAQQKAIALIHVRDFSYEEVSEMLNVPLNTLKSHVRRGREKLRQLKKEEDDHGKK